MKTIGREILWNLPPHTPAIMYSLLGGILLLFAWGVYSRIRVYRRGRAERENRLDRFPERALDVLRIGFGQKKVLEKMPGGLVHLAISSAFIALFLVTLLVALEFDFGVKVLDGGFYIAVKLFSETFGLVLAGGVVAALVRRYILRPPGLGRDGGDLFQLLLVGTVALTGFLVESLRIAATHPVAAPYSYVGNAIAPLFDGVDIPLLLAIHRGVWWAHMLMAFGFLAAIPYDKMLHILAAPANIFLRTSRPPGTLQAIPEFDELDTIGAGAIEDFSWKQLLDLDACAKCGRCEAACPAHGTGKTLSPQKIIRDLRSNLGGKGGQRLGERREATGGPLIDRIGVRQADVWACTTCGQCTTTCPVMVEHVEKIVDMRRHLVLGKGEFPPELEQMFRKLEVFSDPWGFGPARRMEWAAGLDLKEIRQKGCVDLVYWVGCAGAYDERYRNVAISTARILKESGIDFGVLGPREYCCGDFARRSGNEYLFRLLAGKNMAVLEEYGVTKILTSCPHCYHVLKNDYPGFGGKFEIVHHSEFILDLIHGQKIRTTRPVEKTISYHDSCYLGRYGGIFDPPRQLLSKISGLRLVEAKRSREDGFCCGAGGGYLWLAEQGERINERRAAELRDLKPDIVATACPHCLYMLEDGMSAVGEGGTIPESMDISEIVVRAL